MNVGQLDPSHTHSFFFSPHLSFLIACLSIGSVWWSTRTAVNSHRKRGRKKKRENGVRETHGGGEWECRQRRGRRADGVCSQRARKLRSPCAARCPLLAHPHRRCLCLCFRSPHPHRRLFDSHPSLRAPVCLRLSAAGAVSAPPPRLLRPRLSMSAAMSTQSRAQVLAVYRTMLKVKSPAKECDC